MNSVSINIELVPLQKSLRGPIIWQEIKDYFLRQLHDILLGSEQVQVEDIHPETPMLVLTGIEEHLDRVMSSLRRVLSTAVQIPLDFNEYRN